MSASYLQTIPLTTTTAATAVVEDIQPSSGGSLCKERINNVSYHNGDGCVYSDVVTGRRAIISNGDGRVYYGVVC